jgi:hypothetical protein
MSIASTEPSVITNVTKIFGTLHITYANGTKVTALTAQRCMEEIERTTNEETRSILTAEMDLAEEAETFLWSHDAAE